MKEEIIIPFHMRGVCLSGKPKTYHVTRSKPITKQKNIYNISDIAKTNWHIS